MLLNINSQTMNIILFESHEIGRPFRRDDLRVNHILNVLRRKVGDSTDVGLINGPRGKAILKSMNEDDVEFDFIWSEEPPALLPIDLIVGLCRPQTSRKVLQDATSLGVRSIWLAATERTEPSYASSKLWTTSEWERHVRAGVEQAFSTRIPTIQFGISLSDCIESTRSAAGKICLDNYEATTDLLEASAQKKAIVLAVGSERGWTENERDLFRQNGFQLAHLGDRPLRTETAVIASISIVSAQIRAV
jgi:16S rRNA (uracil1498-N3)-methyltransferase